MTRVDAAHPQNSNLMGPGTDPRLRGHPTPTRLHPTLPSTLARCHPPLLVAQYHHHPQLPPPPLPPPPPPPPLLHESAHPTSALHPHPHPPAPRPCINTTTTACPHQESRHSLPTHRLPWHPFAHLRPRSLLVAVLGVGVSGVRRRQMPWRGNVTVETARELIRIR